MSEHIFGEKEKEEVLAVCDEITKDFAYEMTAEELAVITGLLNSLGTRRLKALALQEARLRYNAEMTLRLEGYTPGPHGRWTKAAQGPSEPSPDLQLSDTIKTQEHLEISVTSGPSPDSKA
jgi:hypothetical protein